MKKLSLNIYIFNSVNLLFGTRLYFLLIKIVSNLETYFIINGEETKLSFILFIILVIIFVIIL